MRKIQVACGSLLATAVCFLVAIGTSPVRSADAPASKIAIQHAEYGDLANDKSIDVTQKIAAMVKDENLYVIVSGKAFGDPAPTAAKMLKVGYLIDGIYHSKTANEGEPLDISAKLIIRRAVYGGLPNGPSADVTEAVAAMVQRNSLSVKADNEAFGDPANGVVKKLRVDYTFDGKQKSKTVNENATLTISKMGE